MMIVNGMIYAAYFALLGLTARVLFNRLLNTQILVDRKTELFAQSFFQGVFIHVVLFNVLQFFPTTHQTQLWLVAGLVIGCVGLLWLAQHKQQVLRFESFRPTRQSLLLLLLVTCGMCVIYWNGQLLPNIAWDSWMIWEGKSKQWLAQGLNTEISQWSDWINNPDAVFNLSAHYPDGVSLLYYLPNLLLSNGNAAVHVMSLLAYALTTLLLISRCAKSGAPAWFQLMIVFIMFSIPLINNHLMIYGYADLWVAMYVLLIMLTLMDYHDENNRGTGLTILCYLALLPLLKLEGWVWLVLFLVAHFLVQTIRSRHRITLLLVVAGIVAALFVARGLELSTPLGQLIINHDRLVIFDLLDTPLAFTDVTDSLLTGFFWQNNWSFIWLGLPFLMVTFFAHHQNRASQVSHAFMLLALLCFLFLFYFTKASQWAKDLTALNRIVLQLTPCYLFLLFSMLIRLRGIKVAPDQPTEPGHHS
jgi:hypothetical protein